MTRSYMLVTIRLYIYGELTVLITISTVRDAASWSEIQARDGAHFG
jgi:hypothetical protein